MTAPRDPIEAPATDERYLRLSEVSALLDLPAWYDDARSIGNLGVDEVDGARWLASWLGTKIAALDWLTDPDHGDEVHWWDWCGNKAPGRDNGMYDVVCSLQRNHKGDEHRLEAGGRIIARWGATGEPTDE